MKQPSLSSNQICILNALVATIRSMGIYCGHTSQAKFVGVYKQENQEDGINKVQ